ncbi:MAG TPA: thiamine-phosphate kinase [Terriglobales bacterium]|nr:thiamine-phosphate kinase [Terriglobales bacterium]
MPLEERLLISQIRRLSVEGSHARRFGRGKRAVIAGIGDDCAVLRIPTGHELLVTTDFSLEGVHFRRDWHSPRLIGHRCLTRGLSDIAAMGGEPMAVFLSLALPRRTPQRWVDGFLHGLLRLAMQFNIPLAGGDTTQSADGVLADILVLGSVPKGRAILRSGTRPGDRIYVTGALGVAAAETNFLYEKAGKSVKKSEAGPQPRIAVGRFLRESRIATAMIDISDGLSTDLSHICEESCVGADIRADAIPRGRFRGRAVDLRLALHGGDAYELLFTARKRTRVPASIAGIPVAEIGEVVAGKAMTLIQAHGRRSYLKPQGWEHFR